MATLRYRLVGDPAFEFRVALERFAGSEMDNIHKQVAIDLTKEAKRNLDASLVRPWESGSRSKYRLTGALTGKHGRTAAIQSRILNRGQGVQGKGVGFPDVAVLNRRAAHWRRIEYGDEAIGVQNKMPTGLFVQGGQAQPLRGRTAGDIFMLYPEYLKSTGLRNKFTGVRSRQARGRRLNVRVEGQRARTVLRKKPVRPIKGKHFLEEAWDYVVGPDGRNIASRYQQAIEKVLGNFR